MTLGTVIYYARHTVSANSLIDIMPSLSLVELSIGIDTREP